MYIKEISLKDFRNYQALDLNFYEGINIIIGNNATNNLNLVILSLFC